MNIIKSNNELLSAFTRAVKNKPSFVYIASYKIRVDKKFKSILAAIPQKADVKVLIGLDLTATKKQVGFYKSFFKDYDYKVVKKCHMKLIITDKVAIIGGRNLTNSDWLDFSFEFTSRDVINKIAKEFLKEFNKVKPL
jgi:phosphatidylserine/phosphatidylglycerophosphate/cardiolipin synthase-like enzyme